MTGLLLGLALLLGTPGAAAQDEAPARAEVVLTDGQVLRGLVVERGEEEVVLELADGVRLALPLGAVREVRTLEAEDGGVWGLDPNRSRYLYSPTAFSLGTGRGYVAQRALVLTSAAVGLGPYVDLELGTVLPLLFFNDARVGIGGLKLAVPLHDRVRLTAGTQAFLVPEYVVGFAFGGVTVGTPDEHLTVAGGGALEFLQGDLGAGVMTISGAKRLGPKTSLVTENWFLYFTEGDGPWNSPLFLVPSGGVRLFGPQFAVDLALVILIPGVSQMPVVPIPWVSFAWNWSLKGR